MKKFYQHWRWILLFVAVAGVGYWWWHAGKKVDGVTVCNLVVQELPAAELATRTVSWQSVICEEGKFPVFCYVIARTATIKAGFDLAKLDPKKDLTVDAARHTITLRLPKPEILSLSWGENRVIMERHSLVAAAIHKSGAEENRRRKLFEEALRRDARLYALLDFSTLNEGIARYLAPLAAKHDWKLVVQGDAHTDFAAALDAYLATHP